MARLVPLEETSPSSSEVTLKPLTPDAVEPVETPWHSFATGAGRTEFPDMPEFGTGAISDEKGAFSSEAMRTLAGYISTADEKELANIIKKAVPGATVKTDKFKNPIIRYREKDYYVNKPGFSEVDAMQFVTDVATFAPAAKVASGLKGLARFFGLVGGGATTQIAKEGSTAALGGDQRMIDAGVRVGTAAVAAPAIEGLVKLGSMALRGGWKLATNNGAVTTTTRKILDREGIDAPDEMIIAMQNYLDRVPGTTLRAIR